MVVMFLLNSSWVVAQGPEFRVEAVSAGVHLAPSTGSPVIGRAQRGALLEVTRDLGSWVKIAWPEAQDGVGYVHVSMGSRGAAPATDSTAAAGLTSARTPGSASAPAAATSPGATGASASLSSQPGYVTPPTHVMGLGAKMGGSMFGSGASARAWVHDRFGLQIEVTRSSLTSPVAPERMTATQLAPSLLYSLPDRVTDYVWVRPYLGAGPRLFRHTISLGPQPLAGGSVAENRLGLQAFGGGELTFASLPRFALSADVRYGWFRNSPAGFDRDGLGFSVSGHWYVR